MAARSRGSAAADVLPDRIAALVCVDSGPTTVVCCSMPSSVLVEAVASGQDFAQPLAALHDVTYVDLPTGHWPMVSRPQELAAIIDEVAVRPAGTSA